MKDYFALLRAVNVGGRNKISMAALKQALAAHGYLNPQSYINSGNLLFSAPEQEPVELQAVIKSLIASHFSLDIDACICSLDDLLSAFANRPDWWGSSEEVKHNAIFALHPHECTKIIREIGPVKAEFEQVAHSGRVIYWSAPIKTFSKTNWSKLLSSTAQYKVTVRNANTMRRLAQMAMERQS